MEKHKKAQSIVAVIMFILIMILITIIILFTFMGGHIQESYTEYFIPTGHIIEATIHGQAIGQDIDMGVKTGEPTLSGDFFILIPIGLLILAFAFFIFVSAYNRLKKKK